MGENSNISWTDHTFNPWIGCTKVSPACDHCYAEAWAARYGAVQWGNNPRKRTSAANWNGPRKWQRFAEKLDTRPFVFCASLADIFDNQVDPAWRADAFQLMRETPRLVFLLLTKRPQNIERLAAAAGGMPANAALGCTVVTQHEAERDVPVLLEAKRATRPLFSFLSIEPMLARIDLTDLQTDKHGDLNAFTGRGVWPGAKPYADSMNATKATLPKLDWIICGGESGPDARPIDPAWVRDLRDQCADHDAPFHFKQWGGFTPKAGGKEIDGREWCERPHVKPLPALAA